MWNLIVLSVIDCVQFLIILFLVFRLYKKQVKETKEELIKEMIQPVSPYREQITLSDDEVHTKPSYQMVGVTGPSFVGLTGCQGSVSFTGSYQGPMGATGLFGGSGYYRNPDAINRDVISSPIAGIKGPTPIQNWVEEDEEE